MSRVYTYVQDGNTVRKIYDFPEKENRKKYSRQNESNRRTYREANSSKTMSMGMTVVLALAMIFSLGLCIHYLNVQSDISAIKENMTSLRNEIDTLATKNDSVEYDINSYIDVDYIIKTAKEELGMVDVNQNQIVTYNTNRNEYMEQYGDVPEK